MNKGIWAGLALCLAAMCGLAGPALAVEPTMAPSGVPYLSGGVGYDERDAMEELAGQYGLKLEFARQNGDYLGDVQVNVRGPANLDVAGVGPWFWAQVPPGTYTVTVTALGRSQSRQVTVPGGGGTPVAFFW